MRAKKIYEAFSAYTKVIPLLHKYFAEKYPGAPGYHEQLNLLSGQIKKVLALYKIVEVPDVLGRSFADIYDQRAKFLSYYGETGINGIFESFNLLYLFCKKENKEKQGLTEKTANKLFVYSVIDFEYCIKTEEVQLNFYRSLIEPEQDITPEP